MNSKFLLAIRDLLRWAQLRMKEYTFKKELMKN
jgi:hypothetical protein